MLSFLVRLWTDGQTERQTDRQTDTGKTIRPDLLMQGQKNCAI